MGVMRPSANNPGHLSRCFTHKTPLCKWSTQIPFLPRSPISANPSAMRVSNNPTHHTYYIYILL